MGRSMTETGPTLATPPWCADFLSRDHLIPAPAKLNAADFVADGAGKKFVPSGTCIARTIAERDASQGYGPTADTDPATEVFLTAFDVPDAADINDVELVRPGTTVRENFLPGWGGLSAAVKALIRARYHCIRGRE